jgi:hypothetical protein
MPPVCGAREFLALQSAPIALLCVPRARAEIDRQAEAFDQVVADRLASMKRTPCRVVGAGEDVRFQRVDRLATGQTKQAIVHFPTIDGSEESNLTASATR